LSRIETIPHGRVRIQTHAPAPPDEGSRDVPQHARERPRRYVFVNDIPKSPVGKLLRRKLVVGEFEAEDKAPSQGTAV